MSGYVTKPGDPSVVYFYIDSDKIMFLRADGTYDVLDLVSLKPVAALTWDTLAGKPATFAPTTGLTSITAKRGDWNPSYTDVVGADSGVRNALKTKPEIAALTLQAGTLDLSVLLGKVNTIITALKA